jgi:hypothetical protein
MIEMLHHDFIRHRPAPLRSFLPMAFTLSPFTISVNPNCEMRGMVHEGEVTGEPLSAAMSPQTPCRIVGTDPLCLSGGGTENP